MPLEVSEIVIPAELLDGLIRELTSASVEKAALLFGRFADREAKVTRGVVAKNVEESPTRFIVDPAFLLRQLQEADERGEELVGVIHSHPAPARPSEEDLRFMEVNPVVWIIVSSTTGEIRAYQLASGRLREVRIVRA
ncbi:MAG: M67 family metallopeptidase [Candidatus Korarchaeota archaeon]|nr:M67 family metallopeptidase [Candidatus Korarchaeota archaeon]